ncbi:ABC transporter ATP-binding protein [Pseudonocardia lacus]|uniref:ABC transporter ATP-binding protein n=1 Tax=Pseudonocardia lacus TaxID=2835865 RepID=UPI001BDC15C6|nr:ABC transporter ATP-binding protein [Pseudonocardia lacus]
MTAATRRGGDAATDLATPVLEVVDLGCAFPSARGPVRALSGVSLRVPRGRVLGIVGESGSGKSTLARAVVGATPATAELTGGIRVGGADLAELPPARRRELRGRRIGMVFQDPMMALNPVVPVGRQVAEAARHHLGLSRRDATERAVSLLEQVGVPAARSRLRSYPHQFSGGLRQRVTIAMALSCDPDLLIADEATTALDVTVQRQILDLLAALVAERSMSMVLISHDLGVVAGRTDEVAVMYGGRVVEHGPTREVFHRPRHRYTRALLDSVPRLDRVPDRLSAIPGQPPDPAALPPGCAFGPRCPATAEDCRSAPPRMVAVDGHRAACLHPPEEP